MIREPHSYWEHRCVVLENIVTALSALINDTLSPATQEDISKLMEQWDDALEAIDNVER